MCKIQRSGENIKAERYCLSEKMEDMKQYSDSVHIRVATLREPTKKKRKICVEE